MDKPQSQTIPPPKMSKEEIAAILKTPLDPNLNYFDATPCIEAMAEHIRGLHKLINFMFESLAIQGQSVIGTRKDIVEIKGDLLVAGIARQEEQSAIIMPPKIKLDS